MVKVPFTIMPLRPRSHSERTTDWTETDHEVTVPQYLQDYFDCGKPGFTYIVRRPLKSLRTLGALCRLPCLRVVLSSTEIEAAAIHAPLSRHSMLAHAGVSATAVLRLPDEPGRYSLGASKQTLRRKARYAHRLGVSWTEVSDFGERSRILQIADEYERAHPNETYRNPSPDNNELLSYRLWLAAYSADGRPLLLSVTPVDGELALLSYFRTIGAGDEQSNARYLMTEVLVDKLVGCGVRYLLDSGSPAMPRGLRHFQRMLGFRIVRIRIARSGRRGPAVPLELTRKRRWRDPQCRLVRTVRPDSAHHLIMAQLAGNQRPASCEFLVAGKVLASTTHRDG